MLDERGFLVRRAVLGHNGVVHDLECDTVDKVVGDFALLLVFRVADCKRGAQVVSLLLKLCLALLLFFLSFYPADLVGLDALFNLVRVSLERSFQHRFEIGKEAAATPYSLALANVPFRFLALDYKSRYCGSIGGYLGRGGAELVGPEGAGEGFVGVVDTELGLRWLLLAPAEHVIFLICACEAL
jgi:hypothetical protein